MSVLQDCLNTAQHAVTKSFCRLSEKVVFLLLLLDVSSLEVKLS
jgi:hypothetical protein